MTELQQRVTFDAAHRLFGYSGSCNMCHGHSWSVNIVLDSNNPLDQCGMLVDYRKIKEYFKQKWDHRAIFNSLDPLVPIFEQMGLAVTKMDESNPTAENIAKEILRDISIMANLHNDDWIEVTVKESEDNYAKESA